MSTAPTTVVHAGRLVPALTPRVLVVAVVVVTALLLVPEPFAVIAIVLAAVSAVFPRTLTAWGSAIVLGLAAIAHPADVGDWRVYVAVAAVHLVHVLAAIALVVEPLGGMQLRAFVRPLRRWLIIQVPAQLVLAGALLLQPQVRSVGMTAAVAGVFALVAAIAVMVGAVLLMWRRNG